MRALSPKRREYLLKMLARATEAQTATETQRDRAIQSLQGLEVLTCNAFLVHINELIHHVRRALQEDESPKQALALIADWRAAYPSHTVDLRK